MIYYHYNNMQHISCWRNAEERHRQETYNRRKSITLDNRQRQQSLVYPFASVDIILQIRQEQLNSYTQID